ncbi:MAG: ABC transporter substrate-binding protein [Pseudomonadota bacterium]
MAFAMATSIWTSHVPAAENENYTRVLAIGGAVTEIVYALGEEDRLVGRDSTSTWPPEAIDLPDVGYIRALSPEGVLSVEPDLILARENNGPAEAVEVLKSAGIRWVDVPDNFTVQGIDDNIRIIAEALGVEKKGDALRDQVRRELEDTAQRISAVDDPKRAMFILSMRDNRVMASGTDTAADGILGLAGAQNVISDYAGYKQISDEAVITAAPEVIVMMLGRGEAADHASPNAVLENHPALSTTPAVKNGDIIRVDGLLMLGFGPRTGQAALELAKMMYPDELE